MLKFGNREFRNLQEQVLKNMQNIANMKEGTAVLSEFGIKVVGEVDSLQNLSSVDEYKMVHADWAYGDAFAIGTKPPYKLVILTRANDEITTDHWFDIGDFPMPGPKGDQGPQGPVGPQGPQGNQGDTGIDAGFGSILATAQTLPAGSLATATVSASGPNTAKELSFTFGIPRGADGSSVSWGNIQGTLSSQTDLKDALDSKQDELVSGTNIKTINNQSITGSGNIEINSGVWGNITGDISNQTDLQTALNAKANAATLATVATSGSYNDLSDKPTIGSGTITIKKNGESIDSFGLNQTSSQNINITVPTKASDLTNDSGFISGVAWGDITGTLSSQTDLSSALNSKQDTISDLSTIRSGAAAGATAVQPAAIADMATETWVGQQGYATNTALTDGLATKQNTISDLATIRSGAEKGATSVQPADLAKVAKSGSYNDLINKPTIGNATLTIKKNGATLDTFTANATVNKSINITVPTNTNELDNGAGYQTASQVSTAINNATDNMVTTDTAQTISGAKTFSDSNGIKLKNSEMYVDTADIYLADLGDTSNGIDTWFNRGLVIHAKHDSTNSANTNIGGIAILASAGESVFGPVTTHGVAEYGVSLVPYIAPNKNTQITFKKRDLGTRYMPWRNLYLTGYLTTDGATKIKVEDIASKSDVSTAISSQTKETWTFTLSDGSTVTKSVVLGA